MTFDELLKRNNVSTKLMKFVDDDPYKQDDSDKQYDNIVDAYRDAKQFQPDEVDGLTFYDDITEFLGFNRLNVTRILPVIYRSYPNGDLTDDVLIDKYLTVNSGTTTIYDLAYEQGKRFMKAQMIHKFVMQFNELAKRVNK